MESFEGSAPDWRRDHARRQSSIDGGISRKKGGGTRRHRQILNHPPTGLRNSRQVGVLGRVNASWLVSRAAATNSTDKRPSGRETCWHLRRFILASRMGALWNRTLGCQFSVQVLGNQSTMPISLLWYSSSNEAVATTIRAGRALDSAMTAYRAHIREGSKETLKALSDLRKTLSDEVSKCLLKRAN